MLNEVRLSSLEAEAELGHEAEQNFSRPRPRPRAKMEIRMLIKKRTDCIPDAHTPLFYNATVIVVIYRISTVIYTGEHCIVRTQV